jgi:hypothetical protein
MQPGTNVRVVSCHGNDRHDVCRCDSFLHPRAHVSDICPNLNHKQTVLPSEHLQQLVDLYINRSNIDIECGVQWHRG